MIKIKVKGLENLKKLSGEIDKLIFSGMEKAILLAERTSKDSYLSGKALNRRTGLLWRSIGHQVFRRGGNIMGGLGDYNARVAYSRFWELGGVRRGTSYPARPFLRPALVDNLQKMAEVIAKEIEEG